MTIQRFDGLIIYVFLLLLHLFPMHFMILISLLYFQSKDCDINHVHVHKGRNLRGINKSFRSLLESLGQFVVFCILLNLLNLTLFNRKYFKFLSTNTSAVFIMYQNTYINSPATAYLSINVLLMRYWNKRKTIYGNKKQLNYILIK